MVGASVYGIGSPFSVTGGCSEYSLFQGVMSVSEDFAGETFNLLSLSHTSSVEMYSCRWVAAASGSGCWEKTVMSSA